MPNHSDSVHSMPRIDPAVIGGTAKADVTPQQGIDLDELAAGAILEVRTGNTCYRLEHVGDGKVLISGHPQYCPQPTLVELSGSVGADGELRWRHLEPGSKLVFQPTEHGIVKTSRIQSLRCLRTAGPAAN